MKAAPQKKIELLNSEGPILTASKMPTLESNEEAICLQFNQSKAFIMLTEEEFKEFLLGTISIDAGDTTWNYTHFSEGMKPTPESLKQFING
jgi:hypothetical protein